MSHFEKYRNLCQSIDIYFKGFQLHPLISYYLYIIANSEGIKRLCLYRNILTSYDLSVLKQKNINDYVLFTQGHGVRKNHNDWCNYIHDTIADVTCSYNAKDIKTKISLHPIVQIKIFIKVLLATRNVKLSFKNKINIFLALMPYCNTIAELNKYDFSWVKCYVSFLYSFEFGAFFTQMFKLKGVKTVAICDGMYLDYGDNPPFDAINYYNFISDKLLMWGQYSVDEYQKIGIKRNLLAVGGYTSSEKIQPMKCNNEFKKCCLLLARDFFELSNLSLLEIIAPISSELDVDIKLHPLSDINKYQTISEKYHYKILNKDFPLDECINKDLYDFVIAVNTTAYYEALIKGLPCLRYKDESFKLMDGYDDVFTNTTEFVELVNRLRSLPSNEYENEIARMLERTIGFGLNNYRNEIIGDLD